jgi:hypothetical protein
MKALGWIAISSLALAATGCTSWDGYAAGQSQKYSGSSLFTMYEEWGTPITRTHLVTGGRFYQFRKPATDCGASVWANDLDVIQRLTVTGPSSCAAGG